MIVGNVILVNFNDSEIDWSFFSNVRKITGFLMIGNSKMRSLPFPRLEIISGSITLQVKNQPPYALFVGTVDVTEHPGLNSLKEITHGSALFEEINGPLTAYSNSINWNDIMMNGRITIDGNLTEEELANNPCK